MRFASLGSGSKGNGTLVACGNDMLLIDCGFTLKETERRLDNLGVRGEDLSAVLVTHEHGDHIRSVGALARRYKLPVYASFGSRMAVDQGRYALNGCDVVEVRPQRSFFVGEIECLPVPVPHDAREPCQFVFTWRGRVLGVLTDLGSLTPCVVESYCECDSLLLECNHDLQMLLNGPYPTSLIRRVGGNFGHLSNDQAAALLKHCNVDRLQHLVLSHVSEQNNKPEHATAAVFRVVETGQERIRVASQNQGFDWLEVV
ncbi:MAG: MBL fold metallo-hydrolase [Alcanivoracaceae bacterium]|nr:MBL fold metallo-hydrolase [Alcanivoracaceae bacterium]